MDQHDISFTFTARYYTLGNLSPETKQVWFALHGYAQLAQFFIKKFSILQGHHVYVIAPEGLSRFYTEPAPARMITGDTRVGATWMTREGRMMDINNYLHYLNNIYEKEIGNRDIPVTVLGFSQGAATASRWVADGKISFRRLILWAGILPPDMDFEAAKEILRDKETLLVYGTDDPFLNDSRFAEMNTLSQKLNITPTTISFKGKHDIDENVLSSLL